MIQHKGTNSIETARLLLRRFEERDATDMFMNWASDLEVCKYLAWGPHRDITVTGRRIREWISRYHNDNTYIWAIYLKSRQEVIGSISVEITNESEQSCEVGYCLEKDSWGRGIMTEALRAVLHYLFYEVGYQRILAKHDILNAASGIVMQKAGMQFEKMEYQVGVRRDGSYYDVAIYAKNSADD